MTNLERLKKAFTESLHLQEEQVNDELAYGGKMWDSVGHMALVASIETTFDIMMDTNDVIDMSSFKKCREILGKYGITF